LEAEAAAAAEEEEEEEEVVEALAPHPTGENANAQILVGQRNGSLKKEKRRR
jgi:hypothetical protein